MLSRPFVVFCHKWRKRKTVWSTVSWFSRTHQHSGLFIMRGYNRLCYQAASLNPSAGPPWHFCAVRGVTEMLGNSVRDRDRGDTCEGKYGQQHQITRILTGIVHPKINKEVNYVAWKISTYWFIMVDWIHFFFFFFFCEATAPFKVRVFLLSYFKSYVGHESRRVGYTKKCPPQIKCVCI